MLLNYGISTKIYVLQKFEEKKQKSSKNVKRGSKAAMSRHQKNNVATLYGECHAVTPMSRHRHDIGCNITQDYRT